MFCISFEKSYISLPGLVLGCCCNRLPQVPSLAVLESEIQNGSHWTGVGCQQGCSGGSGGVCCLPSPASRGPTTPSLPGPTCSHVTVSAPVLSPPSLALTLCPSSVLSKMLGFSCTHTTTPESLPKSIFLI